MTNKELVAQNEQLTARVKELEEKLALSEQAVATMQAAQPAAPSKSKVQAEKALELLKAGPVTTAMLKEINPKYPSDPIYFVRTILKQEVKTHRHKDGASFYSLPSAEQKPAEAPAETKA